MNIACGNRYTILDLIAVIEEISGKRAIVQHSSQREGDVRHSQADITLAKTNLNFNPSVSFSEGIQQTIAWYENIYT